MIDPKQITPLLSNTTVEKTISTGTSGDVYLVCRQHDNKQMALKHVSIPASESQTKALIYSGAVKSESQAQRYYSTLVQELKQELLLLNGVKNAGNLLKFRGYQVDQKFIGSGYDVYMLSDYCPNLRDSLKEKPLTKLSALNLAIDLCSALEQLRAAGLMHKDVHPGNIFLGSAGQYLIGDLGVAQLSELNYSSMPDAMISEYTAPELLEGAAILNETADIYSVGVVLYELYNGGSLPRNSKGVFKRKEDKPLDAPEFADVAMSEIILKACAFKPEDRYQSPSDMKQALVLYMQRGDASEELLWPQPEVPVQEATEEEAPQEPQDTVAASADTIAAAVAAVDAEPEPIQLGENEVLSADIPAEEPKAEPHRSLNELGEDELLLQPAQEITVEDFLANLRKNTGIEVLSMDADGNMTTVPGYETEETLPEDTEYVASADNRLDILQGLEDIARATEEVELMTENAVMEAQTPAEESPALENKADEIAAAVQDIVGEDPQEAAELSDEAQPVDVPEEPLVQAEPPRKKARPVQNDNVDEYDNGYEEEDDDLDEKGGTWKKVLIAVIVLLVLAGGAFSLYTFKSDTINSISVDTVSSSSVTVVTDTKNHSAMEVICSTASGEVARVPYTEAGAVFQDLNPNTTYTFTLASTDGKFLLGTKSTQAKTKEMTNLSGFAASSLSAVSATLALSGTGPVPETWVVTLTSQSGENIVVESGDIPILVEGLTPDTTYTATISRKDGDILGGTTECSFTTMEYTTLATFETAEISTDKVSLTWAYSGTVPDAWTVTCEGTDGSSTSQDVNGTECTLDGLTSGETYTISLSCPSLKATDISTMSVTIPSVTVTSVSSTANEDGDIEVSWEYTSDIAPESWRVSYAYVTSTGEEITPTTVTTDSASVTLEDLLPNTTYKITVVGADDFTVGGEASTTCQSGDAGSFTDYGCTDPALSLYILEDNQEALETTSTTFTTQQHISFALEVSYDATEEDKSVKTTYVIRDAEGNPVKIYNSERNWPGTWTTARHTGDLPDPITAPGSYSLEVYFNGQFMADASFTVTE